MKLYSNTTSGKVKMLNIFTEGAKLISESGQLGGKMTRTEKVCVSMNEGKANERTPSEQAIFEMNAKVKKKKEEGYGESIPEEGTSMRNADVTLSDLPSAFCPSKPESKCPSKVENGVNTYAQRKRNGNCIIIAKVNGQPKVFSRRMKDLTNSMKNIPEVKQALSLMKDGDMINCEFVFVKKDGKESTAQLSSIVRTLDPSEALEKYNRALTDGHFELVVFDILFVDNEFIGKREYLTERYELLKTRGFSSIPAIIYNWREITAQAKRDGWEGFILRVPGDTEITYTLNGKAERSGCYKFKFMRENDFVVSEVALGEAGFHATVYSKFKIGQYDENGNLLDCGWAGPGTLKQEQLTQYKIEIDNGILSLPFVVEVEYRDVQEEGYKLEHPVIQRIRFDKTPGECIHEE